MRKWVNSPDFNAEQTNDLYNMSTVGWYELNYFMLKKPSSINFMQTFNIYSSFFSWNFPLMKIININSGCGKFPFIFAMFQNVIFFHHLIQKQIKRQKGKKIWWIFHFFHLLSFLLRLFLFSSIWICFCLISLFHF